MVYKEHTRLVINLTQTKENGKIKCDKYWPSEVGESFSFEEKEHEFEVVLISSESLMPNLIRRKLIIRDKTIEQDVQEII